MQIYTTKLRDAGAQDWISIPIGRSTTRVKLTPECRLSAKNEFTFEIRIGDIEFPVGAVATPSFDPETQQLREVSVSPSFLVGRLQGTTIELRMVAQHAGRFGLKAEPVK